LKLSSTSSSAEVKNEWSCTSSPHILSGHGQRRLDLSTYAASCNAYRASFRHLRPYALLFSEALTMICLPKEVQLFSHEKRHVLGSGDGGGTAVIYDQYRV